MRTVVISCDRCGKEIKGYPVKIVTEYVDRQTGDIWPDNDERLPEWAEKTLDNDFCEDCTRKIVRFALGGLKENPEFKKAVDEMVNSDTHPNRGKDDQVSGISGNDKKEFRYGAREYGTDRSTGRNGEGYTSGKEGTEPY